MILGFALAIVVGLALGLLGGGGSILAVPIFVYVMGHGAKEAIAMSLGVVGLTSLFGAFRHWRQGNVDLRVATLFGIVAMAGTYGGARLASWVTGAFQLVLFAGVMAVAAIFMFREERSFPRRGAEALGSEAGRDPAPPAGPPSLRAPLIAAEGLGVGVLTGLVGVGGGFMIVPALVLLGGISMKKAVGTSLLVIAMKSAAGFAGYLGQVDMAWTFMAWFSATAVVGILAGASLVPLVPQHLLRRTFAAFLVLISAAILYQNRSVISTHGEPAPEAASHDSTLDSTSLNDFPISGKEDRNALPADLRSEAGSVRVPGGV